MHEALPFKGNSSWVRFIRRSKQPELPVVLLEDSGALVGLVLALGAVGLTIATGNPRWDGAGTTCIGVLLGIIAIVLAVEMKSLLIGESASEEDEAAISAAITGAARVRTLIDMRTEHIGPESILVAAKIEFDPDLTMRELADVIDAVEADIRAAVPDVRTHLRRARRRAADRCRRGRSAGGRNRSLRPLARNVDPWGRLFRRRP